MLDGDEVRRRFPFVAPEVIQARFRAGDGFLDPKQLTLGLAKASRAPVASTPSLGSWSTAVGCAA